jgi:phosphoribosylanthranilate isomerase
MIIPQIKVCGITRADDGREALSLGASFLGFILFEGSPRCIDPVEAIGLWRELQPSGALSVAVEVDPDPERLLEIKQLGFDFFQLHFPSTINPARVSEWADIAGAENLWLSPRISLQDDFPIGLLPFADTFLVDAFSKDKFGGTGLSSDWEKFSEWKKLFSDKKWILAGGIGPENFNDAATRANPNGFDVNSAVESEPGIKDHEKLKKLFALVHQS